MSGTGQAYCGVLLQVRVVWKFIGPQDFEDPHKRDFAGLNLRLGIFEQPEKNHFSSNLPELTIEIVVANRVENSARGAPRFDRVVSVGLRIVHLEF